jgi:DNA-binding transcriptional LysR family regulator
MVFVMVADQKSFSRAAEKLQRTQPAITLAIQKLESDFGEKLIDRSGKDVLLTDAGQIVFEYARRFKNLEIELENSLSELKNNLAGRLIVGANESTSVYLLSHIEQYRRLYPKVKVQVRGSSASKIPARLIDGDLELGIISYEPEDSRLVSLVIYMDHLAFVVAREHRFASRGSVAITELGSETFIAHSMLAPYRAVLLREFQRYRVPLNIDMEMPTVEAIRKLVQRNEGVAFLPRMCVEHELRQRTLREVRVNELSNVERTIRLVYPTQRVLSHAAKAFLDMCEARIELDHQRRQRFFRV